jgi:hypothetical protein
MIGSDEYLHCLVTGTRLHQKQGDTVFLDVGGIQLDDRKTGINCPKEGI